MLSPLLLVSVSLSSSYIVSLPLIFFQCLSPPSLPPLLIQSVYLSPPLPSMSLSSSVSLFHSLSLSSLSVKTLSLPSYFSVSLPLLFFQSFSISLFLSLSLSLSLRPPPLSSAAVKVKLAAHIHPSFSHQTSPLAASCDAPGCSCSFKPFPPPPFLFFLVSSVSLFFVAHFLLSDVSWLVRDRSGSVCAVMAYQPPGFLFQPSLALHPSCPSFSSGVLLGQRTEDLGRSSSGSAFAPYSGSTTSSVFNAQLPYGGEPRAAATLGSFVVSVGSVAVLVHMTARK